MRDIKNILITGGSGYVGTVLIDVLLTAGFRVRVLDAINQEARHLIPYVFNPNFEYIRGDVRKKDTVINCLKNIDLVMHLAAVVGYPACEREPELSKDINVNGTKNLVQQVGAKIPIIFASTTSVYGKISNKICNEETKPNPASIYGKQKLEAEEIIRQNKDFIIFRFTTGFGGSYKMRFDTLPNDFTYRALKEGSLIVYQRKFIRSFIHVRDMARSYLFAIKNFDKMNGEVYNVGDNALNFSKEDLCNMIKMKVNYYLHYAEIGKDLEGRDYYVSFDKLAKLGYKTTINMDKGIDELIKIINLF